MSHPSVLWLVSGLWSSSGWISLESTHGISCFLNDSLQSLSKFDFILWIEMYDPCICCWKTVFKFINLYFLPLWYDYKVYFLFKNTFWLITFKCKLKSEFPWKSKGSTLRGGGSDQDCWRAEPAAACWVSSKCRASRACTLAKVVMPDRRVHLSSA